VTSVGSGPTADGRAARAARLPFATAPYERHAELRGDGWWERQAADPRTRVLVVADGVVATSGDGLLLLGPSDAEQLIDDPMAERLYLGEGVGGAVLAVGLPEVPAELAPRPVREVAISLDALQGCLLVHALGVANWHRTHQFCARCGAPTSAEQAGHVRRCQRCGGQHFPRTDPAVIMLILDDDDRALLGHSPHWTPGRYSTLAGFVEPGESLEDAVRREVFEEVGVRVDSATYAASQPWPFPSSLMLGFYGHAASTEIAVDGHEVTQARWFTRTELALALAAQEVALPGGFSISRWLVEGWYGGELSGE
jgi:NAD+ diphosphatase